MKETKERRARYYACIAYPDSVRISDLVRKMQGKQIQAFISPLHEPDKYNDGKELFSTEEEEIEHEQSQCPKKHYHIMLIFEGGYREGYVQELCRRWKLSRPQIVVSSKGYARYLCHIDDPEKQQFQDPIGSVKTVGYLDYSIFIQQTVEREDETAKIIKFVMMTQCVSMSKLIEYCIEHEPKWYDVLYKSGSARDLIKSYMISLKYDIDHGQM